MSRKGEKKMADEKKNRFGPDPYFCPVPLNDEEEADREAYREAMKLDDNEDTLAWKGTH